MFVIIGWVVTLGLLFGLFIAHGGNVGPIIKALPWEMGMIGGATVGAFLVNNQMKVIKATMKGLGACFKGSKYSKARYMELLALLFDILQKARKEGLMAIEKDVEEPEQSEIFKKYPTVGSDHHVVEFITDYLRMMVSGNLNAHEIESIMDTEIETHHHEAHAPVMALQRIAGDILGLGIESAAARLAVDPAALPPAAIVAGAGIWALRHFDPNAANSPFPPCSFLAVTGYYCIGCGLCARNCPGSGPLRTWRCAGSVLV